MEFANVGVLSGARFGVPAGQSSLLLEAGGAVLRVFNPVAGETVRVGIAATGPAAVLGFSSHGAARVAVTVGAVTGGGVTGGVTGGGVTGSLAADLVACARMAAGVGLTGYLAAGSVTAVQAVGVMAARVGESDFLLAARPAGSGIEVFRIGADLSLQRVSGLADTGLVTLAGVAAMACATVGGRVVVFAASGVEQGITSFALGADGVLVAVDTKGAAQGVPVQGLTVLKTVEMAGEVWLIAGSAESSSLTVFRITAEGAMEPVDHVIDDLATRFDGVSALDAIAVGGRVFVVVAGADDGISLLTLLPGGVLVHLATIADAVTSGLANVAGLRLAVVGGVLQVFAVSGAEAGVTQLSVDLRGLGGIGAEGTAGDDLVLAGAGGAAVSGGAGRDIVMDGAGRDTLAGGMGADVFVLGADGQRDVITDFDILQDRIDLTRWVFFRNAGQLQVTVTATGAVLRFGTEELELRSADGRGLTEAALRALDYGAMSRMVLGEVPVVIAPPPAPDIIGTAGNDTLTGTAAGEVLSGLGGDDVLIAGGGADTVQGGAGRDWLSYAGLAVAVRIDLGRWQDGSAEVADDLVQGVEGFIGTGLGDVMAGARGAVAFRGGAGNDTLAAGSAGGEVFGDEGDDSLTGGVAGDVLWGGAGGDGLLGGDGDDSLDGGAGNDRLYGGAGLDRLGGGDGDDWIEGGEGVDVILDGAGNDTVFGGAGNEGIFAVAGDDRVHGGDGEDTLEGGAGNDWLYGGAGLDRLGGGDGDDWIEGGEGLDVLNGGVGNDSLAGDAGNDRLSGLEGDDWLWGGDGDDLLNGGSGHDVLEGGAGNDRLSASIGNDMLRGDAGDDLLAGLFGADRLWGGDGRDTLDGGRGDDALYGGAGADVFVFASFARGEVDVIGDFADGVDRLRLMGISGTTDAARFGALGIRDVTVDGVDYAEITRFGHMIRLEGIAAADLTVADFLFR